MLWTMIVMTAIFTTSNSSGGADISTVSVPGFTTEDACNRAGWMIGLPTPTNSWYRIKSTFTCVPMGE